MPDVLGALCLTCLLLLVVPPLRGSETRAETPDDAVLWRDPSDPKARNLLYGSAGAEHQPRGTTVFVDEDHAGSNPKFYVQDQEGTKWTAKMGVEAKPEAAAEHLLWEVGYFTDGDYFVSRLIVEGLPSTCNVVRILSDGWNDPECATGAPSQGSEESRQLEMEEHPSRARGIQWTPSIWR